jgi:hypothetical protein
MAIGTLQYLYMHGAGSFFCFFFFLAQVWGRLSVSCNISRQALGPAFRFMYYFSESFGPGILLHVLSYQHYILNFISVFKYLTIFQFTVTFLNFLVFKLKKEFNVYCRYGILTKIGGVHSVSCTNSHTALGLAFCFMY